MNEKNTFGKWLKNQRDDLGLSQKELADKIGIHWVSVNQYENGKNLPANRTIRKMSAFFNVDIPSIQKLVKGE